QRLGDAELRTLSTRLLAAAPDPRLLETIRADLAAQDAADPQRLAARAAALVLGSPGFQRR
ncbi:MAG TPA: hypothetical protein VFE05_16950, partial [Longimicrobiaceae bacterium]|nr:hypothetical protein [Longimicrobiaceae bacterium]